GYADRPDDDRRRRNGEEGRPGRRDAEGRSPGALRAGPPVRAAFPTAGRQGNRSGDHDPDVFAEVKGSAVDGTVVCWAAGARAGGGNWAPAKGVGPSAAPVSDRWKRRRKKAWHA